MRHLIGCLLFLACVVAFSPGCVSGRVAEANLKSVNELADIAVAADPENIPAAEGAIDAAEALREASGTLPQIINFGVPTDLVEANTDGVKLLVEKITAGGGEITPETKSAINRGLRFSDEIAGREHTEERFKDAAKTTPVGGLVVEVLTLFGSLVGSAYGLTRGRKHVARWWATPPTKAPPPAPPALPSDLPAPLAAVPAGSPVPNT